MGRGFEFQGQEVDVDTDWREMVGCENSHSDADFTPKTHVARTYGIGYELKATLELSYVEHFLAWQFYNVLCIFGHL